MLPLCSLCPHVVPLHVVDTLSLVQNSSIHGRPIFVREDREAGRGSVNATIFVNNLSYETTWKELKDHFRQAGEVERAEVMEMPDGSGRSKGWGTIKFARAKDAQAAINQLSGQELQGRVLEVRIDNKPGQAQH